MIKHGKIAICFEERKRGRVPENTQSKFWIIEVKFKATGIAQSDDLNQNQDFFAYLAMN